MKTATVYAVAFEIYCPDCGPQGHEAIPAETGSFMWDKLPESVTCPICERTFKTSKSVHAKAQP